MGRRTPDMTKLPDWLELTLRRAADKGPSEILSPPLISLKPRKLKKKRSINKLKQSARAQARVARLKGLILKGNKCEACEATWKLEMHHDDYNQPLKIRWLCQICHRKHHKNKDHRI